MKLTKKILAILLSAVLVLGLLAACSNKQENNAAQSGNPAGTDPVDTNPFGMLVFTAGDASVSLQYNAEGTVLAVEDNTADGQVLLETGNDVVGMSCSDAVATLTEDAIKAGSLTNNLIIKQSVGTEVPSDTFLKEVAEAAEKAATAQNVTANMIVIAAADLDENGYISVASAKEIVMGLMGVESLDSFDGDDSVDGSGEYLFYVTAGDVQTAFTVHGVYGTCHEMSEDELRQQGGEYGEMEDPAFEETEPFDNLPTDEATEPAEEATEPTETEPAEATEPTEA